ncbi:MAG: hypothetical protein DHS20C16_20590 [Phycisphaerae bacterium]|nr:MAG: hypothetical protein DHS20C16_20590 [Phycisphaerae bacterium]
MDGALDQTPSCTCNKARKDESTTSDHRRRGKAQWLAIFLIRFYQSYLRLHLFGRCRYWPTCSEYGVACVESHGAFKGSWFTLKRILRCHPFSKGGFDPVPPSTPQSSTP